MERDSKNVAEAFPHTGFDPLVCAEVIPLDSESVVWKGWDLTP